MGSRGRATSTGRITRTRSPRCRAARRRTSATSGSSESRSTFRPTRSAACSTTGSGVGVWQYADSVAMKAFNANGSTFKFGDPRVGRHQRRRQDQRRRSHDRRRQLPEVDGSFYNRFTWKGFDLSALDHREVEATRSRTARRAATSAASATSRTWTTGRRRTRRTRTRRRRPGARSIGCTRRRACTTDGSHWRIRNITARLHARRATGAGRIGARSVRFFATAQDPVHPHGLHRHRPRSRRRSADAAHAAGRLRTSPGNRALSPRTRAYA